MMNAIQGTPDPVAGRVAEAGEWTTSIVWLTPWPEPPRVACSQVVWVVAVMAELFEACQWASRSRGGMWPISPRRWVVLYQSILSMVAFSAGCRVVQGPPRRISSAV
jgi:hypothetical protein